VSIEIQLVLEMLDMEKSSYDSDLHRAGNDDGQLLAVINYHYKPSTKHIKRIKI
jgi:hypothetical protein